MGTGRVAVLCCAIALLAAAPAGAATTALIGPPSNTASADTGPISCGSNDCVAFNTADANGGLVAAPGPGTLTSWTAGGLEGTGRLVVLRPVGNGELEIVAQSSPETEPCVGGQGFVCGGGTVDPNVYTFATDLPVAAGDQIGVELISQSDCNAPNTLPGQGCAYIGTNPPLTPGGHVNGGFNFFEHTPPPDTPTGPTASVPLGEQALVDATETLSDITALQLQALKSACASAPQSSLRSILSAEGYSLSFSSAEAGTVSGNVAYDGSGGGSSVLTYGGSSGGSVLVYNGSSGGSVLVYEGSSGGSVLTYDGSGGGSVLTYDGSSGGSVLTYEGSGGGSVAADPGPAQTAASQTLQCGAALGINLAEASAAAKAKAPSKVRICIRKTKHAKPSCRTFRHVSLPAVATGSERVAGAGSVTLKLKLTRTGRLLLLAGKEADRVYRRRHRNGHKPPKLPLRVSLAFTP